MNKYSRKIKTMIDADGTNLDVYVDVYDVLIAFNTTCPAMAHAIKKCLAAGQRGSKSSVQDKLEAMKSIERSIDIEKEYDKDGSCETFTEEVKAPYVYSDYLKANAERLDRQRDFENPNPEEESSDKPSF